MAWGTVAKNSNVMWSACHEILWNGAGATPLPKNIPEFGPHWMLHWNITLGKAGRLGEPPRQPPVRPRRHREREEAAAIRVEVAEETEGATPCRRHEPEFPWPSGPDAGCAEARRLPAGQSTRSGHMP